MESSRNPGDLHIRIQMVELPQSLAVENVELKVCRMAGPTKIQERKPNPVHPDFKTIRFDVPDTEHIDSRLRASDLKHT